MKILVLDIIEASEYIEGTAVSGCIRVKYSDIERIPHLRTHLIFLDTRFHDIPTTTYRNVKRAMELGVHFISVHVYGGQEMIQAAIEATWGSERGCKVIGITEPVYSDTDRWQDFSGLDGICVGDKVVLWKQEKGVNQNE